MKQKLIAFCAAALLFTACNNEKKADGDKKDTPATENKTTTTDGKPTAPAGPPDSATQAAMMQAWMDFATPGPEHAWMAKQAGTWVCDSVSQWMDPSQPPTKAKATDVISMGLNGLYQMTDFSSNMMGQPMNGKGLMGFDKMKKKFVLSWVDNMGSGIVRMEGTYDEATKILNMMGKQSDPGSKTETDIRQELKFHDDNSYTMAMYGTGHDEKSEQKFMEGTFKRKK
jgi:Protein of unknown function (DUF1579)